MNTFVGLSGVIECPDYIGMEVRSIQSDVSDPATNDVSITLSGIYGTHYVFSAVSPVVGQFRFLRDEDIYISSTGTSITNVIINYINYGSQDAFLLCDPSRVTNASPSAAGRW